MNVLPLALVLLGLQAPTKDDLDRRIQTVLADVAEFASRVDAGKRKLSDAQRVGQPDRMLNGLRVLIHEHPSLGPQFLKFLRSGDQPLMARALAVVSVAQPHNSEVAKILGEYFAESPDLKLVTAALFAYSWSFNIGGGQSDWRVTLESALPYVSTSPGWKLPGNDSGFLIMESFAPGRVDLRPMLDALLKLLERKDLGILDALALRSAWDFSRRREATAEHEKKVRGFMERAYLTRNQGWHIALDYLTGMHGTLKVTAIDVLAKGFPGLDERRQLFVLAEVARRSRGRVFESPFSDDLKKIVAYLGRPESETTFPVGSANEYLRALKECAAKDEDVQSLLQNPSPTLQRRLLGSGK